MTLRNELLPHALSAEFPELADVLSKQKHNDAHFARLLEEHDALDQEITNDETGVAPIGDDSLETLKVKRARLKDELYRLATAAK